MESFSASGNLEKYGPSPLLSQRPDMKEKIHQYRSQSINSSHDRSISGSSSNSTRQLLPLYLGQDGVNDRNSSASVIGRPITPGFNYQRDVVQPAPAASLPRQTGRELASPSHSRSESLASVGLPAPPRRTRSPLLNLPILEPTQSPRRVDDEVLTEQWLSHQRSTQTFGHQDSPSARSLSLYSEEGEASPSEWSSRSLGQGVHPQTASGQPMLSAVASALPMYVSPRSPPHSATLERTLSAYDSAPSPPPKGHRPFLLSHAARSSSVSSPTLRNP
ncbi:hypothetical protein BDZ97DRAFT_448280 [Flammula alnicola]|nr:hypothetical protein BDZ97DRAFT_448280 [Flammula alnicola]